MIEHIPLDITEKQKANLLKLAEYLSQPEIKADFTMKKYTIGDTKNCTESERTRCGTVGCAIGHGPYAGIPKKRCESWNEYAERVFTNGVYHKPLHQFLFEGDWHAVDNSREGVVKRIHYALKHGVPFSETVSTMNDEPALQIFYHKVVQEMEVYHKIIHSNG